MATDREIEDCFDALTRALFEEDPPTPQQRKIIELLIFLGKTFLINQSRMADALEKYTTPIFTFDNTEQKE